MWKPDQVYWWLWTHLFAGHARWPSMTLNSLSFIKRTAMSTFCLRPVSRNHRERARMRGRWWWPPQVCYIVVYTVNYMEAGKLHDNFYQFLHLIIIISISCRGMFDTATEARLIISMTKPVLNIKHSIFYRFQCRKPGNGIPRRKPCDLYRDGGCPDRRAADSYYHPISSGSWSSRVNARGLPHTTNSRFLNCSTVHFAPKNTCITKLIQIIFL